MPQTELVTDLQGSGEQPTTQNKQSGLPEVSAAPKEQAYPSTDAEIMNAVSFAH